MNSALVLKGKCVLMITETHTYMKNINYMKVASDLPRPQTTLCSWTLGPLCGSKGKQVEGSGRHTVPPKHIPSDVNSDCRSTRVLVFNLAVIAFNAV